MAFSDLTPDLVKAVAACLPDRKWQATLLDYEIREVTDGFDSDYVSIVLLVGPNGKLEQDQFFLDRTAREAAVALYRDRKTKGGDEIAGFVLRLEASGKYRMDFKHELKRLAGIWCREEEERIDNYLEHYLAERD